MQLEMQWNKRGKKNNPWKLNPNTFTLHPLTLYPEL